MKERKIVELKLISTDKKYTFLAVPVNSNFVEKEKENLDTPLNEIQSVPEIISQDVPEVASQDVPEVTSQDVPEIDSQDAPEIDSQDVPEVSLQDAPERVTSEQEILKVEGLEVNYGVIRAIKGIDFHVNEGEIVTLIGANGAGKTTTMQSIVGLIPKAAGKVVFEGSDISKTPCHKIAHLGMTQVPEGRRIFQELTVYENLLMGAYSNKDKASIKTDIEKIYARFPRLAERKNQIAGTLSGGEQQMLAMGRALMGHPRLLMLDEPSMGLSPLLVDQVFEIIKDINKGGTTVLLVEQNAGKSLAISDRAYVLENGEIVLSGTGKELSESEMVRKAYLGG